MKVRCVIGLATIAASLTAERTTNPQTRELLLRHAV